MKCKRCGMNYEGKECPNCKVADILSNKSRFETEEEFDIYLKNEEDRKLNNKNDKWLIAFGCNISLGIIIFLIGIFYGKGYYLCEIGCGLFGAAVLSLLFWYLAEIRRLLITLNKKNGKS